MTQVNVEMLEALEVVGVPKDKARAAAASAAAAGEAATKADLAELKAELTVRMTMLVAPLYVLFAYLAFRVLLDEG